MKHGLLFFLFSLILSSTATFAYDFHVDGIYYNKTGANTVAVSYNIVYFGVERLYNYKDTVVIPEKITVNGVEYTVTSIAKEAFSGCENLLEVSIPQTVTSIGDEAFDHCRGLKSITIPSSVTRIGNAAFSCCSSITSVVIPNSVDSISRSLFWGCSSLQSVEIPNTVKFIDNYAFMLCTSLTSATLPQNITYISNDLFNGCTALSSITIPNSVTTIGTDAFKGCTGLTSITIPNSIRKIESRAFQGCTGITTVTIPDEVEDVAGSAFDDSVNVYVNKGTPGLLGLWKGGYIPYQCNTNNKLFPPTFTVLGVTQTTVKVKAENLDNSFDYWYSGYTETGKNTVSRLNSNTFTSRGHLPGQKNAGVEIYGVPAGHNSPMILFTGVSAQTLPITPTITLDTITATSFSASGTYIKGDAHVMSQTMVINDSVYDGNAIRINGLKPATKYTIFYEIIVGQARIKLRAYKTFYTDSVVIKTLEPKVVSEGNVIVCAQTNIGEDETDAGFEWRRTDYDDSFPSSTGIGHVYDGKMEGYIRNMNANRLWKYRAYYQSSDGEKYYGDWVGIDPANTSYFEPTVHTYAHVEINGNTALLKGYAQRGTDNIQSQGFIYWKTNVATAPSSISAVQIPADAVRVNVSGTVMETKLEGLDFNTEYTYVAFISTTENETFYGDERTFSVGEDPEGVISAAIERQSDAAPTGIYDLRGRRLPQPQKGINIIRYQDGTAKKVIVR